MVSAWYMDKLDSDQRDPHKCNPNRPVSLKELDEKTGVIYLTVKVNNDGSYDSVSVQKIQDERGYTYKDEVEVSPALLSDFKERLKNFYTEHLHADEEIRLCVKGGGYFDVRDGNDEWIRIQMEPGDLLILPAGIYHRFTLDHGDLVKVLRFFVGDPVWTPVNRPADDHPARIQYIQRLKGAR